MSCEFICDGCGKREAGIETALTGKYEPPRTWHFVFYGRNFKHACCQVCVNKIEKKYPEAKEGTPY